MSNIRADTLSTLDGTKSITTDRIAQGVARAWVNFNGTGTVAIRASFNVSSITDNGVGDYTVNFTTAMPDANYCVTGTTSGDNNARARTLAVQGPTTMLTTSVRVTSGFNNTNFTEANPASVAIFR